MGAFVSKGRSAFFGLRTIDGRRNHLYTNRARGFVDRNCRSFDRSICRNSHHVDRRDVVRCRNNHRVCRLDGNRHGDRRDIDPFRCNSHRVDLRDIDLCRCNGRRVDRHDVDHGRCNSRLGVRCQRGLVS